MIKFEERISKKVSGETSLFITFAYNDAVINAIKEVGGCVFHKKEKEWEAPVFNLLPLIDLLSQLDQVSLSLLKYKEEFNKSKILPQESEFKTPPYKYQLEGVTFGLNNNKWLLLDAPGLGKAVTLETEIYTPTGKTTMGDISVGDYVIDKEGNPTKVVAVYNHDNLTMYRVKFSDGTFVDCCEDHQWLLRDGRTVSTKWFLEHDSRHKYPRINSKNTPYCVPLCKPVEFTKKEQKIHPYVLGAILGDGSISHGTGFTSKDPFIISKIRNNLLEGVTLEQKSDIEYSFKNVIPTTRGGYIYYANNKRVGNIHDTCEFLHKKGCKYSKQIIRYKLKEAVENCQIFENYAWTRKEHKTSILGSILEELSLLGCTSHTKFIPDVYKYSDIQSRVELLQGLIDTDGYVADNHVEYSSVSKQLCKDVREIVESLGGICSWHEGPCGYNGKLTGISYSLTIRFSDPRVCCSLPRKLELLNSRKLNAEPLRKFVSIEKINNCIGRCITVDSPSSTYLCKNFIVTHNTLQIVYLAQELKRTRGIKHCLIICGVNSLKGNWVKEIEKHSNLQCRILGQQFTKRTHKMFIGSVAERISDLKSSPEEFFWITNIETIRSDDFVKEINKQCLDMIVCDEIHTTKSPTSQQGKNFLKLNTATYQVGLTGTLLMNNPLDCYVPLKWIGKEKSTYSTFKSEFLRYGGSFNNEVIGYKNIDFLKSTIQDCSLRRTKDILDLPPKNVIPEYIDLDESHQRFYNNIVDGIVQEVDKVNINPTSIFSMLIRLRQALACPSMLTTTQVVSTKINRAVELSKEIIENGDKVVIFSTFKGTVDALCKELIEFNPLILTGDVDDNTFEENKIKFQEEDKHKICICTWQKAGTGITLTAARYAIFIDTPYTYAQFEQCSDRIHRIGTTQPVFIYNLIANGTIDERVNEILMTKQAVSDFIIDDILDSNSYSILKDYILELKNV